MKSWIKFKILSWIFLILLCFIMLSAPFDVKLAGAEPRLIHVDDDNTTGPWDGTPEYPFQTLNSAVENASANDTVFVHNGTYREWNIALDKDFLSIVGENRDETIIDGMKKGWILRVTAQNVTVTGFTLQNSSIGTAGVFLNYATNCRISDNMIRIHDSGIYSAFSNANVIDNNFVANNNEGIILSSLCRYNRIKGNTVVGNTLFAGIDLSHGARNNTIECNKVIGNLYGILITSDNNTIFGNQIENNEVGVYEYSESTSGYKIFHNNFVDNTRQIDVGNQSINFWDDGYPSGGNYWSDYENRYPNAKELDSGIWDTPYIINGNNSDLFPLMTPTKPLTRVFSTHSLQVTIYSNSSISGFQFNSSTKQLSFNVAGPSDTTGFSKIAFPNLLLWGEFTMTIDDSPLIEGVDYVKTSNSSHNIFNVTYLHGTHRIEIVGTEAIPEISTWISLLIASIMILVRSIHRRRPRQ